MSLKFKKKLAENKDINAKTNAYFSDTEKSSFIGKQLDKVYQSRGRLCKKNIEHFNKKTNIYFLRR